MILVLDMLNVMGFWIYGSVRCSGVHGIVSGEQVGWDEQSHSQCHVYWAEERGRGVPVMEGDPGECHKIQRSKQFQEEN